MLKQQYYKTKSVKEKANMPHDLQRGMSTKEELKSTMLPKILSQLG